MIWYVIRNIVMQLIDPKELLFILLLMMFLSGGKPYKYSFKDYSLKLCILSISCNAEAIVCIVWGLNLW